MLRKSKVEVWEDGAGVEVCRGCDPAINSSLKVPSMTSWASQETHSCIIPSSLNVTARAAGWLNWVSNAGWVKTGNIDGVCIWKRCHRDAGQVFE